jgi:hypothetical protein
MASLSETRRTRMLAPMRQNRGDSGQRGAADGSGDPN